MKQVQRLYIAETEPFWETCGPKALRKRLHINAGTFEEFGKLGAAAAEVAAQANVTAELAEAAAPASMEQTHADHMEPIHAKGISRRIYGELYKVIDSSDILLHILDARDPLGTLCESVLEYIRKEKAHKQVVLVINTCNLVPNWVTVSDFLYPNFLLRRERLLMRTGLARTASDSAIPNNRIPRVTKPFIWQRFTHPAAASILAVTFRQKANLGRVHRVSKCWEEQRNQHVEERQGLSRRANSWRNEGP